MATKRQNCVCTHCGRAGVKLTDDHVPPECLFPQPRPSTLITVPACEDCNRGSSKDDEYFRLALVARRDLQTNDCVKRLGPKLVSGLDRKESAGLRQYFLDNTRVVTEKLDDQRTSPKAQLLVDFDRVNIVVRRIVKGLYYHEFEAVMPPDWSIDSFCDAALDLTSTSDFQAVFPLSTVLRSIRDEPARVIEPDVFEYQYTGMIGSPDTTAWLLSFYRSAWFLVFVNCEQVHTAQRRLLNDASPSGNVTTQN